MMKKNLNVDVYDPGPAQCAGGFLDRYEQIKLDCMIALTSARCRRS